MARDNLNCIIWTRVAFATGLLAVIAIGTSFATVAIAQDTIAPSLAPTVVPAPVGHRQPRPSDLPPSVQREEQVGGPAQGTAPKNASKKQRIVGERGSNAVPAFDAKETCQATEVAAVFSGRNLDTCINSEEATRDQLKKSWSEFSAADRAECVSASKIGGLPSYVELLTCLEMERDVERIHATSPETTGVGGANDSHRKRHARQQQMPAPQQGKTTSAGVSRNEIREIQRALGRKGYYTGRADGIFGPWTKRALRQFQQAQQLPITGEMDDRSLAALRQSDDQGNRASQSDQPAVDQKGQSSPSNQSGSLSQRLNAPNQSDDQGKRASQSDQPAVDKKGSPDQERSAGSKSSGQQETSGQSSPSNQSSSLSQRPNAPNQSDDQGKRASQRDQPAVDQKGSPDQERSAGSKSSGQQETSGQSSPGNHSSSLSQEPNAPSEPIAGEGAKRSWWQWWQSLWQRLWR